MISKYEGLSVVLPVVKTEHLHSCLESIVKAVPKEFESLEVVIVLAAANLRLDLENYTKLEINVLDLPNAKYGEAIAFGVENCRNELIALMNDDDLIRSNRFSRQVMAFDQFDIDIAITDFKKFGNRKKFLNLNFQPQSVYHYTYLLLGPYGANATWMFTKTWFNGQVNQIDPTKNFDWIFALNAFKNSRIYYDSEKLYFYRQHKKQTTRSLSYRTELYEETRRILHQEIEAAIEFKVDERVVPLVSFPYLKCMVTYKDLSLLFRVLRGIWSIEKARSVWLIYQISIRIVLATLRLLRKG